jgi:single-strand DNA-binding protein
MPGDLWTLRGNLGKDAVVKSTSSGTSVANFSIARSNGKDKPPTWFNVQAWKETADACRMLKKGDSVCCVGFMKSREWENKTYWEFNAWDVYVDVRGVAKNDTSTGEDSAPPSPEYTGDSDDGLPF